MGSPSLIVYDSDGRGTQVAIDPLPFQIGRHADNHLVIRDSRASRRHARIVAEGGEYVIEDSGSLHGVFVNGKRIQRQALRNADRIEFGFADSYSLMYTQGTTLGPLAEQFAASTGDKPGVPGVGANLAKLRAVLEVARALESSFSMDEVLGALVDAAMAVTGSERGFMLFRNGEDLEIRVARNRNGEPLGEGDLRVPRRIIHRALKQRRELLSMNFDPLGEGPGPEHSVADLELRSVVCVPLVRINIAVGEDTSTLSPDRDTVGVLYMDSRLIAADLSGGNRELLQTLAIEASTVLENARLLEEERIKQKIEEELTMARAIQQSLLPRELPVTGWFRACGSSLPSHQVGGDYFDVVRVDRNRWAAVVADVSGKGVSSALLASLLQGAFVGMISGSMAAIQECMCRVSRFLSERTEGGKYATVFLCLVEGGGELSYINAGHCPPLVLSNAGAESLEATAVPLGLLEDAAFEIDRRRLAPGDKIVIYSDGITEAQNPAGEFFGRKRLREVALREAAGSCQDLHAAVRNAVAAFTESAEQSDDITLLVLEYYEATDGHG